MTEPPARTEVGTKPPVKNRRPVGVAVVVHLVLVALTWRDLDRRTATEVRGSKSAWRVASGANTLGAIAYWLVGRKPGEKEVGLTTGTDRMGDERV